MRNEDIFILFEFIFVRFLQYAPSGRIARELRGDTTFLAEVNSDKEEGAEDLDSEYSDYIIP